MYVYMLHCIYLRFNLEFLANFVCFKYDVEGGGGGGVDGWGGGGGGGGGGGVGVGGQ